MNEKILTYEEAEKKIIQGGNAKIAVRLECGVADIFDIYKEKYIGTVGSQWADYIATFGKLLLSQKSVALRRIKITHIINIFEMEVYND